MYGYALSQTQQQKIASRYLAGEYSTVLAKDFHVTVNTILNRLRRQGIAIRNNSDCRRRFALDEFAFSRITPESAYWIGFLMADGSIAGNAIRLELAVKDISHIEKFRTFLKSEHKIAIQSRVRKYNNAKKKYITGLFIVCSDRLSEDLGKLGVVPRKTFTATVAPPLAMSPDFWRGVIDGDGCLYMHQSKYPAITLTGSGPLVTQFITFAKRASPLLAAGLVKQAGVFQFHATGRPAIPIISVLYKDASVFLDRKFSLAHSMLTQELPT